MHLYLETERLIVRQYMLNDIDELVGIMSDIRVHIYIRKTKIIHGINSVRKNTSNI